MIITDRKSYYNQDYLIFNIISQLKYRYLSVRKRNKKDPKKFILARYYQGYTKELFLDSLKRNCVLEDESAKLYMDLAQWQDETNNTPIFSFDKKKRKEQKEEFSKKEGWKKLMKSYSFAIDIDNENLKKSWKEAKTIKEIFDNYKLPYSLSFSGGHGFHFIIDSEYINLKKNVLKIPELFGKVMQNLVKDEFGAKKDGSLKSGVDLSIYDCRRIIKLRYSLNFKDGKEYVCLPLDDLQFANWKLEDMELQNVMKNVKFFKRGILERNFGLSKKQLSDNFNKFVGDYM